MTTLDSKPHCTTVAPVFKTGVTGFVLMQLYKIGTLAQRLRQRRDRDRQIVALADWQRQREAAQR